MFVYQKKLQYPVRIKNTNPKLAAQIISQYGGPDGELGASLRYLSQRYSMPYAELKGLSAIGYDNLCSVFDKKFVKNNMVFFSVDKFDRNCCKKDRSGCGCRNLGLW